MLSLKKSISAICLSFIASSLLSGCNKNNENGGNKPPVANQQPAIPASLATLKKGQSYYYYQDASCKSDCLTVEQAMDACKSIKGITKGLRQSMAPYAESSAKRMALVEGGSIDDYQFNWRQNMCFGEVTVSGIYNGNSARLVIQGPVTTFLKTNDDEILAHYLYTLGWGND